MILIKEIGVFYPWGFKIWPRYLTQIKFALRVNKMANIRDKRKRAMYYKYYE